MLYHPFDHNYIIIDQYLQAISTYKLSVGLNHADPLIRIKLSVVWPDGTYALPRQRGDAQKVGIVGIQCKIQKMLYGTKINKVKGFSPRWQWESVGIISVSHTASKH